MNCNGNFGKPALLCTNMSYGLKGNVTFVCFSKYATVLKWKQKIMYDFSNW